MKVPYTIPSMDEVRAIPWNGYTVASTFSGCGGSSLGYRMAGFRVLWASEFIPAAAECYRANMCAYTMLDTRDIRSVSAEDILSATGLQAGQLDILDGSPPCAAFSTAGKRDASWGKVKKYSDSAQRVDDLFFEYARILEGVKPKTFVAENVRGLVIGRAKGYFLAILKRLKECGYRVECRVLNAKYLGVPQSRERTIFVGVREDIAAQPAHPSPRATVYSVADACPLVTRFESGGGFGCASVVRADSGPYHTIGTGPSSGNGRATHVFEGDTRRLPTIAEVRALCSFPHDFILTGTYAQQYERLGRAVPPLMMKAIAETVRDKILCVIR
ncbi:MAG: Modification methylase BspRI [Candidatus Hydrogenedentes bacterium ADurb.Bin179]|nr:MAG: Modification methylase BspRI [Candidatus Hydrogenedentes bacterium ADurb.Bin179]